MFYCIFYNFCWILLKYFSLTIERKCFQYDAIEYVFELVIKNILNTKKLIINIRKKNVLLRRCEIETQRNYNSFFH